ncbi:arylesterase [Pedobacter aquatilis]|uniref:arylesterase n=1 Tax=Pedobacter aquatilis TaxID=351343 RepID=UPI0025B46442|nr:arylesterase [Pedobacter aquatilis]MDN3585935.1 arylesterase [Pedobacter aquatilis]
MSLIVFAGMFTACSNNKSSEEIVDKDSVKNGAIEVESPIKTILFFGTSLTAGLGLDPTEAYPAIIQQKIDAEKLPYKVINAGLSGETSAAGKSRIDWLLKQKIDVFVLELGSNDGLRGLPVAETAKNLQSIIDKVKAKYPEVKIVIAGMQMPPSMGAKYTGDFKNIFPEVARKNNATLIPFLLDKVGGVAKLNQADGIHPTAEGDKILADNVWVVLKPLL